MSAQPAPPDGDRHTPESPQPVHVVYGGAHLFRADVAAKLGAAAVKSLDIYAPTPAAFAEAVGLPGPAIDPALPARIYERVLAKLRRQPVEDYRIDFEDGYGPRSDAEEDGHAVSAAREMARGLTAATLPPCAGIRIKPLTAECGARALRTLDLFVASLADASAGRLPDRFVVTLPKVTEPGQVGALADRLEDLEGAQGLPAGSLRLEIMIETPQAVLAPDGRFGPRRLVESARGRCIAAHFGPYDYTAAFDIAAAEQRLDHPACDFARHIMQVSLAGTGVHIADGPLNILPVPVWRAESEGPSLTTEAREENRRAVWRAWNLHYQATRRSLAHGFYQGWDLHPAQLPTRYAAVYGFFDEGLAPASARLQGFLAAAAQATRLGSVFDDAATGQGLLNFFLRAVTCGAITAAEATERTGLSLTELQERSFLRILRGRQASS